MQAGNIFAQGNRQPLLNMATGPVEVSAEIQEAQCTKLYTSHTEHFWEVQSELVDRLGRLFDLDGLVLPVTGSIRSGLDIALSNFIGTGSNVLVIENGFWGQLIGKMCEILGATVHWVSGSMLQPIDPEAVREAMTKSDVQFDLVTAVHVETNTGVINPIEEIGAVVAESGAFYLVDAACSLGVVPYSARNAHADITVTGSHKCLASVPGVTLLGLNRRALDHVEQHGRAKSYFFDLARWIRHTHSRVSTPWFTQPVNLLLPLNLAVGEILAGGTERQDRFRKRAFQFVDEMRAIGIPHLLDAGPVRYETAHYSSTVIALALPDGIHEKTLRNRLLSDENIFVIGNLGPYADSSIRVGMMSPPQIKEENVCRTIRAIKKSL
jgi:alanine-glyoxylate transaminase/serine-glyoxylate transaminase/serine-pyruvate transaminase